MASVWGAAGCSGLLLPLAQTEHQRGELGPTQVALILTGKEFVQVYTVNLLTRAGEGRVVMNDDSNSTLGLHNTLANGAFIVKIPTLTAIISPFSWQYRNGEGSGRGGYPHFMGGEPEVKG